MAGASGDEWRWCINLWATPRSLSTSLMYAFAQRPDTEVVDEPLYAHYLRDSGAQHPMREEVLAAQNPDGSQVVHQVIFAPQHQNKLRFVKNMAKHCTSDIRPSLLSRGRHVLLVREPLQILSSFSELVPPSLEETGLIDAVAILSALKARSRQAEEAAPGRGEAEEAAPVVVVDARDLACNPEGTLRALCGALDIPFFKEMLSWAPGPRAEDGAWAPLWYKELHRSRGFTPAEHPYASLLTHQSRRLVAEDPSLYSLLQDCHPFYTLLRSHALAPLPPPTSQSGGGGAPPSVEGGPPPPEEWGLGPLRHLCPPLPVPANEQLLVWVGDGLVPRCDAKVHVLDSIAQGGDGVWEGLRVYHGRIFKLQQHLDRLLDSAKSLAFQRVPSLARIRDALVATLAANGMRNNAHVRLTLTRGLKVTSGMSPHFNQYGCTLIVLAEWKPPVYDNARGISLVTASNRRNPPQCLDSKIHHNNLINNILAKIEGNNAGAEDAVMLDINGFVSETNATNIFLTKQGVLLTPSTAHACLPGITRATVLDLARGEGLAVEEGSISTSQLHSADEIFTTGTMGELTPCVSIDNRQVGSGAVGPITRRLQLAYQKRTASEGWELPPFYAAANSS